MPKEMLHECKSANNILSNDTWVACLHNTHVHNYLGYSYRALLINIVPQEY